MVDTDTPPDLRRLVGVNSRTRMVDLKKGVYLCHDETSDRLNLWVRVGLRWHWAMRASSSVEVQGLVLILDKMGCSYRA